MPKTFAVAVIAVCAALAASPSAYADRAQPVPIFGFYDLSIDFSKQTFNNAPTPMNPITFPVELATNCDVNGCVVRMDNSDDHARNPSAPAEYSYQWVGDRWETSGQYPYWCDRNDPDSVVQAQRSDYWIPNADGSFYGVRTLVIDGAGCPGEGPGTHTVPISLTPIDPPVSG